MLTSFIYAVGKYGVDVDTFETVAIEELSKPVAVCIIDEIGKMETLFSKKFNAMVQKILDNPNVVVVGTVAMQGGGFIGEVRHRKGSLSSILLASYPSAASQNLIFSSFFLFFSLCCSIFFFFQMSR